VPTHDSAEAFDKLVAARSHLTEVTKRLNEAHADLQLAGNTGRQRYAELQAEWGAAFTAFEKATDEFAATVKKIHQDVEAHGLPKPDSN